VAAVRARSTLVPAVVLALALALSGCGGDDEAGGDDPDTSLIPPETTGSDTTTESTDTTASTASTAPSAPTAFTAEAADAVNELKTAWETGDQARARAIAPGDVVEALFLVPPEGFEVQGCDSGEFETSSCTFRNRATEAFISVSAARSDAGWQIATIDVNGD
jgi:hypothetical protein